MSTPEHLERFERASEAFTEATGRKLTGYLLCAVDERGEVYWGGKFPDAPEHKASMFGKLSLMRADLRSYMQRKAA